MIFWEDQQLFKTLYAQHTRSVCSAYGLTQMEFDILMFLYHNPQYDTAAGIVRTRMLTKSHVSAALKELEARGCIVKSHQDGNQKTVHLKIAEAAVPIVRAGEAAQEAFIRQVFRGFSGEEFRLCKAIFSRMRDNARAGITQEDRL